MIIWKLCHAFRLKEAYRRLPMLLQKNKISTTICRRKYEITAESEAGRLPSIGRKFRKFRVQDKVPRNCELIYTSSLTKLVVFAYYTSHALFLLILSGFYVYTQQELEYPLYEPDSQIKLTHKITIYSDLETYCLYIIMILYNGFGFLYCRRTVLRIWHNPINNLYTLVLPKLFAAEGRQITTKPGNIKIKYKDSQLAIVSSLHTLNGWTYYINPHSFAVPREYSKLIGFE